MKINQTKKEQFIKKLMDKGKNAKRLNKKKG